MLYHLETLLFDSHRFQNYTVLPALNGGQQCLCPLSKINIFVGANNSGKSRLIRRLASTAKLKYRPKLRGNHNFLDFDKIRKAFEQEIGFEFNSVKATDAGQLQSRISKLPSFDWLEEDSDSLLMFLHILESVSKWDRLPDVLSDGSYQTRNGESLLAGLKNAANRAKKAFSEVQEEFAVKHSFNKIYIPTLRGLRAISADDKDYYNEQTLKDYFRTADKDVTIQPTIFSGLTMFREVRKHLLGNLRDREKIASFQEFLSEKFFEGASVALIPKESNSVLDIKIGDEAERPIHDLGDGIQSLIILTFPLFTHQGENLLVFCEEPELYLHPGLQRVLLTVMSKFDHFQYFLTTHSNHFLDLSLDFKEVSVFTVHKQLDASVSNEKNARFVVENISNQNNRPLQMLGVRNSSVFLSNCTIWVEGITDRRYFRKYLNLYQQSLETSDTRFTEDLHYSFVEYGGSNITHWSFLDSTTDPINVDRLCGKLFLIADSDNAKGAKAERIEKLKKKLGEHFVTLKCKEVENLIKPEILTRVLQRYEQTDLKLPSFVHRDYQNEALGDFIEKRIFSGKPPRNYSDGGTIRDKNGFCEKAVASMDSIEDVSEEAKEVVQKIYKFIKENNK